MWCLESLRALEDTALAEARERRKWHLEEAKEELIRQGWRPPQCRYAKSRGSSSARAGKSAGKSVNSPAGDA